MLFPFYFTFCLQRTHKHSSSHAYTNYSHRCAAFSRFGAFFPVFLFSLRVKRGVLVALQAVSMCVGLSLYCRVVWSVTFNLRGHVLYNFRIHVHLHFKFFSYIFICLCFIEMLYIMHIYMYIISITGYSTQDNRPCSFSFPLKRTSTSELYLFVYVISARASL